LARLYIGGQMATLVSANAAKDKSKNKDFVDAINYRIKSAKSNLKMISSALPELTSFLASPNDANAQKVVSAMKDKDLSSAVSSLLPKSEDYKQE